MTEVQMLVRVDASPSAVHTALTESGVLSQWFAEAAEVDLAAGHYDFWGRFTPDTPRRDDGRHPLLVTEPPTGFVYRWELNDGEQRVPTYVGVLLEPIDTGTRVLLRHTGPRAEDQVTASASGDAPTSHLGLEDFWFLSLENLRRHLVGRAPVLFDFSQPLTHEIRHVVEIAAAPEHVFAALIEPNQLERWMARNATIEPRVGGRYDLGWEAGTGGLEILQLEPDRQLSYAWKEGWLEEPNPAPSVVTWTLEGSHDRTFVTFVHSGFAPGRDFSGEEVGWLMFLSWLKSLVEFGPDWTPAAVRIRPGWEPYYPAAVIAQQPDLARVTWDEVGAPVSMAR